MKNGPMELFHEPFWICKTKFAILDYKLILLLELFGGVLSFLVLLGVYFYGLGRVF